MADNLKIIETNIDAALDENGGPESVKVVNHKAVLKQVLNGAGKYSGLFFNAKGAIDDIAPIGTLLWNGNAPDTLTNFTIRLSQLTVDGNDIGVFLSALSAGAIIHFKDKAGRSYLLIYQSHAAAVDPSTNNVYDVVVQGLAGNGNFIYQPTDEEVCSITFYNVGGSSSSPTTVEYLETNIDPVIGEPLSDAFIAANPNKLLFITNTTDTGKTFMFDRDDEGGGVWVNSPFDIPEVVPQLIVPSGGEHIIQNNDGNPFTDEEWYYDGSAGNIAARFTPPNLTAAPRTEVVYIINDSTDTITFNTTPLSSDPNFKGVFIQSGKQNTLTGHGVVKVTRMTTPTNTAYFISGDLDASAGGGGIGGTIAENQIAHGTAGGDVEGTDEFIFDGENVIMRGSGADRFIRFIESLGQFNGAFIQFEGSTNKFHVGVHATADADKLNDTKVITIQRADGFVGINTETPNFELDMEGTFRNEGVRISPTFTDFTGRVALVNPSFGGSRLGDSDLQTPTMDIGSVINFIDSVVAQQVNWSIFENNDVMTIRSAGGNFVGVVDVNGANQADYTTDDAEATIAQTINYTNGFGYVNDHGVQRYLPGVAVVAQSFFHVMINSGGAPRLKHIMTYYDGTTYDVIREIEIDGQMVHKKIVRFEEVTKGIDGVDPEDFVTKSQLDAAGGGGAVSSFVRSTPSSLRAVSTGIADFSTITYDRGFILQQITGQGYFLLINQTNGTFNFNQEHRDVFDVPGQTIAMKFVNDPNGLVDGPNEDVEFLVDTTEETGIAGLNANYKAFPVASSVAFGTATPIERPVNTFVYFHGFGLNTAPSGGGGVTETKGTFLPELTDSGGGATYTVAPANNISSWVRQGSLVHVQIRLSGITQAGVNSGLLQLTGLPFASAANTFASFQGILSDRNGVPAGVLISSHGNMAGGSTAIDLYNDGGVDAIFGNWGAFNVANNGFMIFNGTYEV